MVFAQARIEEERFVGRSFLIKRQGLLNRRILNIQGRHHAHQIFALQLLDLLQLRRKLRGFRFRFIQLLLLLEDH